MDESLKAVLFGIAIVLAAIESARSYKSGSWIGWLALAVFIVPFFGDALDAA